MVEYFNWSTFNHKINKNWDPMNNNESSIFKFLVCKLVLYDLVEFDRAAKSAANNCNLICRVLLLVFYQVC